MRSAIDVYIQRVNGTPAMGGELLLYPGDEESPLLTRRPALLTFLKKIGGKKARDELKSSQPALWDHFTRVADLQKRHTVLSTIPSKYAFILKCCFQPGCIHPICSKPEHVINWRSSGPSIDDTLPIPVIDESNPGHYLKRFTNLHTDRLAPVPSVQLAIELAADEEFDEERVAKIAHECMIKPDTVLMYVNHLKRVRSNILKGVEKAKITRAKNKKKKI